MRYTTDGTPVTADSPLYAGPLALPLPTRLRAARIPRRRHRRRRHRPAARRAQRAVAQRRGSEDLFAPRSCWRWRMTIRRPASARSSSPIFSRPAGCGKPRPWAVRRQIALTVGQIPFNFQLGADLAHVKVPPSATPEGEFEVRAGTCEGPLLAMLPLRRGRQSGLTRLVAPFPCARATRRCASARRPAASIRCGRWTRWSSVAV